MVQTTRLQLPLIAAAQAQKHVTHNEAILRLDGLCQMQALSYTVSAQPGSPADGDLYLLPAGKTGAAWGGAANHAVAHYYDGVWHFYAPRTGWIAFITDTSRLVYHNGTQWTDVLTPSGAAAADGSVSAPGFAFSADTDVGLYRIGANKPGMSAGGTLVHSWSATGNVQPAQPAFQARVGSDLANVTGDGTSYQVVFGTEDYDIGGVYNNSTGLFTAPVAGWYAFSASIILHDIASAHAVDVALNGGGINQDCFYGKPYSISDTGGLFAVCASTVRHLNASDTFKVLVAATGGSKVIDVNAGSLFSGFLLG